MSTSVTGANGDVTYHRSRSASSSLRKEDLMKAWTPMQVKVAGSVAEIVKVANNFSGPRVN